MTSVIDCSNVFVLNSPLTNSLGVFAKKDFKKDEIIEYGLAYIIDLDGHKNDHVFTWYHPDHPDQKPRWASCSGCATYYNTSLTPNVKMIRDFDNNKFEIIALKDINKNEELFHTYKSLKWRKCFTELYTNLQKPNTLNFNQNIAIRASF